MSIPQSGGGPIENFDQLADLMESGCKPKADWRIGTEHEKFGWLTDTPQAAALCWRPLDLGAVRRVAALMAGRPCAKATTSSA